MKIESDSRLILDPIYDGVKMAVFMWRLQIHCWTFDRIVAEYGFQHHKYTERGLYQGILAPYYPMKNLPLEPGWQGW